MEQFYEEIETKRDSKEQMRIKTDLEFRQREIQKLNQKYNVLMFHTKIRGGKAFDAEQKIREFKKILQKSKRMHESTSTKRTEPKKIIQSATNNLNSNSQKYGVLPNFVEENAEQDEKFCKIYDIYRLVKVQKYAKRYKLNDIRQNDKKHKKIREPLAVGEKVFVLPERLKKEDAPGIFYKSTTENKPFFNREEIFFIRRNAFINNSYNYWISKTVSGETINKRFLRQELFALKEQFI